MPKSKLSAFISLMLVFLSGALVGAFASRLYLVNAPGSPALAKQQPSPQEFRRRQIEDLKQKVKLDDHQVEQYNAILDNTHEQFEQIREKFNAEGNRVHDHQIEEVKQILRADQLPLYEKWRLEREAEHKRRQQEREAAKKK